MAHIPYLEGTGKLTTLYVDEKPFYARSGDTLFEALQKIIDESGKKLLLLVSGEGTIMRYIGPCFGVCMYLCLEHCGDLDSKPQPLLKYMKPVRDHIL